MKCSRFCYHNRVKTLRIIFAVSFSLLAFSLSPAQDAPHIATQPEIEANLKAVNCKNRERFEATRDLFKSMGAAESDIVIQKGERAENIVVTKKGKSNDKIIIAAHYDKVGNGCGVMDNWSGIVIAANLYRTFRTAETEKTLVFIALDEGETGLWGSNTAAKAIPKEERGSYCAVVNIDSFGLNYPQVQDDASTTKLRVLAEQLAGEIKMPFGHAAQTRRDSDANPFIARDIPAVSFHGLSDTWQRFIHTQEDQLVNINYSSVFVGYQFLLRYVAKLDTSACSAFRK